MIINFVMFIIVSFGHYCFIPPNVFPSKTKTKQMQLNELFSLQETRKERK